MNGKEMKAKIHEQVFKANFVRKLKHVLKEMEEYRDMRAYLIERGRKKNRKAIKDITKRLRVLALERQQYDSEGNGMRGDPAPSPEVVEQLKGADDHYVYTGGPKPKTGSGDKNRKINTIASKRAQKRSKW